jgi:TetR/AcrR family transcriptional repressor of nem operon
MSKGARTREQVVEHAAALFNQHGYHGASISDVMAATGLKKGGIYRHFASKEALALAAFEFATDKLRERFTVALAGKQLALEADDGNPELRAAAQRVLGSLKQTLRSIVKQGQEQGELREDLDLEAFANVFVAQLEGAVMLAKLYGTQAPMRHVVRHLESWLEGFAREA